MKTDAELLRCYVEEKSEPAFAELVERHIGLVHSVALRRVGGDAHLAEDVAQTVFNDLARKAASLRDRATLGGWLYVSANVASASVVRAERRRKVREATAQTMQTTASAAEPDWTQLRPVIDDAIVGLKDEEREAVVLRFFEKRSFAEIGAVLRVTEEAARKRVERALDKLRVILEQRGVTSTAAALGVALVVMASNSAPAALGAKVASHALATAGATGGGVTLAGWLSLALPTAAVLVLGGLAIGQQHANDGLRSELGQFAADRGTLASLRTENRELARRLVDVAALRTTAAQPLPALPRRVGATPPPARPIASTITVTTAGTIQWEKDLVSLRNFTERLKQTKATVDPESRVLVRIDGTSYSALTYVVDEARKAGIEHLTVEGGAKTDGKFSFWWQ